MEIQDYLISICVSSLVAVLIVIGLSHFIESNHAHLLGGFFSACIWIETKNYLEKKNKK